MGRVRWTPVCSLGASLLGCRPVTVDGRLRRGADQLGFVVGPTAL
jgi:hypothetical protein